jgi:hypothetical protein
MLITNSKPSKQMTIVISIGCYKPIELHEPIKVTIKFPLSLNTSSYNIVLVKNFIVFKKIQIFMVIEALDL